MFWQARKPFPTRVKNAVCFVPDRCGKQYFKVLPFHPPHIHRLYQRQGLDSIIIGLLCFIGTTIMNTPYAILVSVIVGVTNVIPFFGPYLGAIPSALLILIVDITHPLNCVYFVLFIFLLQQFDGNILGPKILGDSTGLSGFWVIFPSPCSAVCSVSPA